MLHGHRRALRDAVDSDHLDPGGLAGGADGVGDPERHQVVGGEGAGDALVGSKDPLGGDLGLRPVVVRG
jgi:hypothetical protein